MSTEAIIQVQELPTTAVDEAREALSAGGRFFYTTRNLYYELVRRGALALPSGEPDAAIAAFDASLEAYEKDHGRLSMLLRPSPEMRETRVIKAPEALDFAVQRILVFDRMDLFLLFAANGFYRKIEMALVLFPDFPTYVWQSVVAQLRAGITTSFYVVHDGDQSGYRLSETVSAALAEHGAPDTSDLGLTLSQAHQLGVPIRIPSGRAPGDEPPPWRGFESESPALLGFGAYAHIEEMPPLAMLRWAYSRVAKGHEEIGFG